MKKISLDGLTNVLSPKEMKNITGGSMMLCCWGGCSCTDLMCGHGGTDDCSEYAGSSCSQCG